MFTGPHIITDGLIFALDAGNPECFTSGNTTATDLVQGFNCSGASGTPGSGTHTPNTANFPAYNSTIGTRYTTSGEWTGYMGPIYFYNRKLNAIEVAQNFNSQRTRFEL